MNNKSLSPEGGIAYCLQSVFSVIGTLLLVTLTASWPESGYGEEAYSQRGLIEEVSSTRKMIMLREVCDQGGNVLLDGIAQCGVCPSYTSEAGKKSPFKLINIVTGSFSGERLQEAVLTMSGCEANSGIDGGMVLVRNTSSGWKRVIYQNDYSLKDCLKFRTTTGVSSLLCNQSVVRQRNIHGEIVMINMDEEKFVSRPVMTWFDNINSNPRRLVTVFPYRFLKTDFNQDARNDLRIIFRIRDAVIPDKYPGAIDAIQAGYNPPQPRILPLTFLFDGQFLKLHKESRNAFREINQLLKEYTSVLKE